MKFSYHLIEIVDEVMKEKEEVEEEEEEKKEKNASAKENVSAGGIQKSPSPFLDDPKEISQFILDSHDMINELNLNVSSLMS